MRLRLKSLHKTALDGSSFIRDLDLEIKKKEFVSLIGPYGSGKSTVLRLIAGLDELQSGEIYIDDVRVDGLEPRERHVAMIFENSTLMPDMTVQENIAFRMKQQKIPKEERLVLVREMAELLEIEGLLKKKPRALSLLETQKVILARAMAGRPRVLLLDDPYAHLPEKVKLEMHFVISLLFQKMDTTIVCSTNDPMTAMALGTMIVVMDEGRVVQADAPMEIYDHPGTLFAAELIGQPPINVWEAKLKMHGKELALCFGKTKLALPAGTQARLAEAGYADREVIAAIRPENIDDSESAAEAMKGSRMKARVLVRQMLGAVAYLDLKSDDVRMVAAVNPRTAAAPGQKIKVVLDPQKLLLFDAESKELLTK